MDLTKSLGGPRSAIQRRMNSAGDIPAIKVCWCNIG
jgi:hypothetical protein